MGRRYLILLVLMISLCHLALALDVATIYNGEARLPENVRLGEWGSAQGDTQILTSIPTQVKAGSFGVPISTLGRYQGTRFDFNTPLDTRMIFGARNAYLELYLRTRNLNEKRKLMPDIPNLRFIFFTTNGIGFYSVPASEFYPAQVVQNTWVKIDLPLSKLDPALHLTGTLNRLVIASDAPASFLLGRMAVVHDTANLRADIAMFPALPETGQTVFFSAGVEDGISPCLVTWDFDTAAGASIDATGDKVTYTYTNPGTYTVTCTVHDANGVKDSITVTREIKINRTTR